VAAYPGRVGLDLRGHAGRGGEAEQVVEQAVVGGDDQDSRWAGRPAGRVPHAWKGVAIPAALRNE
jgi:hypothetical protein